MQVKNIFQDVVGPRMNADYDKWIHFTTQSHSYTEGMESEGDGLSNFGKQYFLARECKVIRNELYTNTVL